MLVLLRPPIMAQPLPWKYHFLLYTFFMICSPPIHPRIKLTLDSATFLFLSFELLTFFFYNRSNAPFRLKNLYMECSVLIVQPGATCILHYPSYLNKNPIDIFFFTFFFWCNMILWYIRRCICYVSMCFHPVVGICFCSLLRVTCWIEFLSW